MHDESKSVGEAISDYFRIVDPDDPTMLVPRFIVVAEVIDRDGDEQVRLMQSPGLTPWVATGMLSWATRAFHSTMLHDTESDDDDDE